MEETGITEEQARDLIGLLGYEWTSLLRAERHLLGAAIRCAMARCTREVRPTHHLLQSFCPMAQSIVWDRLMDAITKAHDGRVQMIDTSIVRLHQQGATAKRRIEIIVSVVPEAG